MLHIVRFATFDREPLGAWEGSARGNPYRSSWTLVQATCGRRSSVRRPNQSQHMPGHASGSSPEKTGNLLLLFKIRFNPCPPLTSSPMVTIANPNLPICISLHPTNLLESWTQCKRVASPNIGCGVEGASGNRGSWARRCYVHAFAERVPAFLISRLLLQPYPRVRKNGSGVLFASFLLVNDDART
jgi:hypothetical protein